MLPALLFEACVSRIFVCYLAKLMERSPPTPTGPLMQKMEIPDCYFLLFFLEQLINKPSGVYTSLLPFQFISAPCIHPRVQLFYPLYRNPCTPSVAFHFLPLSQFIYPLCRIVSSTNITRVLLFERITRSLAAKPQRIRRSLKF